MSKTIIIKYGGSLLEEAGHREAFLQDIARLAQREKVALVHGGGKEISKALEASGLPVRFVQGRRFTDDATMQVVEITLAQINAGIVDYLKTLGVKAHGYSGKTEKLMIARTLPNLGRVGQPQLVHQECLEGMLAGSALPVFYSVACDSEGAAININADDFALALAVASRARRLMYLTDTGGILDKQNRPIGMLAPADAKRLIDDETITGGMAVKVQACVEAVKRGVGRVDICKGIASLLDPQIPIQGTSFVADVVSQN